MNLQDNENNQITTEQKNYKNSQIMKPRIIGIIILAVVMVAIIVSILIMQGSANKADLVGKWDIDGVTSYQFNDNGTGAMILPHTSYDFSYKIDGDNIAFDYYNEKVSDGTFSFKIDGDKLTLIGGNNTNGGTFNLTRIE